MIVHHLNCVSSCPLGGCLMDGVTKGLSIRGRLACHCLLIETEAGLVLCDTGFGLRDVHHPRDRLSAFFLAMVSPDLREEMTARRQIEQLGFKAHDVRHIVLTHLDFDHAGGLDDFPNATVHMLALERDAAASQKTWLDRQRFRPQQWSSSDRWKVYYADEGEHWMGLECTQQLQGLPPEIALVPLTGHTHGHAGIGVKTQDKWLLHAGDAYFYKDEMNARPYCTPGLRMYQWMMDKNRHDRIGNQKRLRMLSAAHRNQLDVFCSHDVTEFERLAGRALHFPAQRALVTQEPSCISPARNRPLQD